MLNIYYSKNSELIHSTIKFNFPDIHFDSYDYNDTSLEHIYHELMSTSLFKTNDDGIILKNCSLIENKVKLDNFDLSLLTKLASTELINFIIILNRPLNTNNVYIQNLTNLYNYFELNADLDSITTFFKTYCLKNNININSQNLQLLINRYDFNIPLIQNELSRLSLIDFPNEISNIIIDEYALADSHFNIFNLTTAMLQYDKITSEKLISDSILAGQTIYEILGLFASQLRFFYQVKLLSNKLNSTEISNILKVHPYRVKTCFKELNNISITNLTHQYKIISEIDYKIKTGQLDSDLTLTLFLNS